LIEKFCSIYGIQRFITVFTGAHHWTLPEPDEPVHILTPFYFKILFNITVS